MILISKAERKALEEKGCVFNKDIFRTYSKNSKLYLVESPRNLRLLDKCRSEHIIKTVER